MAAGAAAGTCRGGGGAACPDAEPVTGGTSSDVFPGRFARRAAAALASCIRGVPAVTTVCDTVPPVPFPLVSDGGHKWPPPVTLSVARAGGVVAAEVLRRGGVNG
ncbi:hypothetical protein JCM33774_12460 [Actinophytocola sp. KF-1]